MLSYRSAKLILTVRWRLGALLGLLAASTFSYGEKPAGAELSAFQLAKQERILRERLSCLGCHRFAIEGGRIAPDLSQARDRHSAADIKRIILDPEKMLPGAIMPRVRMRPEHLDRLVAFLIGHRHADMAAQAFTPMPRAIVPGDATGREIFQHYCAPCHGEAGRGDGPNAKALSPPPTDLTDVARLSRRTDDALFEIISAGGRVFDLSPHMPAWGHTLSAAQIDSLVAHLRGLCQCAGPAWSTDGARP